MSFQPLYGTISDNQGHCRTSSSRRGRVTSISCWINSLFGTVLTASASYRDNPIPDLRKIPKDRREAVKQSCSDEEKIGINIDIEPNPHYNLRINGLHIPYQGIKDLEKWNMQKFEIQLKRLTQLRDNGQVADVMKLAQQIMVR